jgi:hypothetical protein
MSIIDMDSSINILEKIVLSVFPNFNFITIEETVVFPISIVEEDEITALIINVE